MVLKGLLPGLALVAAWSLGVWWSPLPAGAQAPAPATGATRIAFIDSQRVVARSAAGVAARDALEREKAAMQKKLDGEQAGADQAQGRPRQEGAAPVRGGPQGRRPETLERRVRDLRRLVDDFEKDYTKKDRELMGKFLRELSGVVQKVGKDKGFTLIVDARGAGVIYGAPEADLTEEIIRAFDDETKKAKK